MGWSLGVMRREGWCLRSQQSCRESLFVVCWGWLQTKFGAICVWWGSSHWGSTGEWEERKVAQRPSQREGGGGTKGNWGRFGVPMTHLSLIPVCHLHRGSYTSVCICSLAGQEGQMDAVFSFLWTKGGVVAIATPIPPFVYLRKFVGLERRLSG